MNSPSEFTEQEKAEIRAGLAARLEHYLFDPSIIFGKEPTDADLQRLRKSTAYIPVTCCVMTDTTGVNHCTHAPPPPIPWRRRLRWRDRSWWPRLRLRAGSFIAGVDLDDEEGER